ncbi:hypothetical protein BX661DRAFT_184881 [Kickxella alabastrina]|uniref:uncharacterized protein n=1 Tax=Kickxella alabastrina TaxID=61397 RepID=UPI0022208D78|nr:uncharacterized protein BX661DRAFT_184881 [Kickxella alabastrina]KAI7825603.1 hypothetical protein BX661DRAFT_184881 [Kickxella alabastrina]
MKVDAKKEYGFPASELPDVAPKKFNYAQHAMGKGSGGGAGLTNLPDGIPNCLEGLKFVVTGEFGDMTREQITDLIKSFGGSGKTSYLVVGDEPGSSKVKKAKTMKTLCLYEHDLIAMIRSSKHREPAQAEELEDDSELEIPKAAASVAVPSPTIESKPAPVHEPAPASAPASASAPALAVESKSDSKSPAPAAEPRAEPAVRPQPNTMPGSSAAVQSELWTEKYKPTKLKDLCGHKTSAQEILRWLSWWASGTIPEKRATTTAHLVAKLAGFDVLELNASETRSKSSLKELLGPAVGNRSVLEFDKHSLKRLEEQQHNEDDKDVLGSVSTSGAKKLLVIMDEVDGMSGGDRGGSAELIQIIKRSRVPIICICNDRMSPKNLRLEPNALVQMVQSTHNDIRQIINLMSSYALSSSSMSYLQSKAFTTLNRKEVAIGPFDVIGKFMNRGENASLSFSDKLDLYYNDFSIIPLFARRASNALETLDCLSNAADFIAEADIVETKLRGSQQWGLMPLHSALSCVGPAFHVRGAHEGMYRFPGWLGQNSKAGKLSRYLKDVQSHMRLRVSADKTEIRQSYIPAMVPELVQPLVNQGASGIPDSAFTREYKKTNHPVAFQPIAGVSSVNNVQAAALSSLKPDTEDVIDDDEGAVYDGAEDDDNDNKSSDDVENDALIAAAKPKPKPRASKTKAAENGTVAPRKKRKAAS